MSNIHKLKLVIRSNNKNNNFCGCLERHKNTQLKRYVKLNLEEYSTKEVHEIGS